MSNNEKSMRTRKEPHARKSDILEAALVEASESGFNNITRKGIAERAGVSDSLVNKYMGTLSQLRRTVMRQAVKHEHLTIIAQGIVTRNPYALKASDELQARALASFNKV
jgi:AcrR family transcriptional regulator